METTYILHAKAITPSGSLPDSFIQLENGKITRVATFAGQPHSDGTTIDASGLILSPGWIDIQLNGGFGLDFTDDPETIWEVAQQLPQYGTTSFLPTVITSPLEKPQKAIEVLKKGYPSGWTGATPLGLHLEGPFLNPQKKGAHNPKYLQNPAVAKIDGWSRENGVWLVTLAPELEGAAETIKALVERGVVVSAGHSMATYDQAKAAFAQGVTSGTHLYNAMPPLLHRDPGLPGALLTTPGVFPGLIADGIHCHVSMLELAWKAKGAHEIVLTTDAMGAMGMPSGKYPLGDFEVHVDEVSARLSDGTLAGSILTTAGAVQNMVKWLGLPVEEVVPALTSTPARMLKLSSKGVIAPNADADLVLITPEGKVVKTIVGGQVVFSH